MEHFRRNPLTTQDPGKVVKIDEMFFTRRKYKRGRVIEEQ